jgi:hypothetical protein
MQTALLALLPSQAHKGGPLDQNLGQTLSLGEVFVKYFDCQNGALLDEMVSRGTQNKK